MEIQVQRWRREPDMPFSLLWSAIVVLVFDQLTKVLILSWSARRPVQLESPTGRRIFRPLRNPTVRFGLAGHPVVLLMIWSAALSGILLLVLFIPIFGTRPAQLALGTALGGATGNLLDSLFRQAIVDFIDLHYWPVFNIADVAIVIGVGLAITIAIV